MTGAESRRPETAAVGRNGRRLLSFRRGFRESSGVDSVHGGELRSILRAPNVTGRRFCSPLRPSLPRFGSLLFRPPSSCQNIQLLSFVLNDTNDPKISDTMRCSGSSCSFGINANSQRTCSREITSLNTRGAELKEDKGLAESRWFHGEFDSAEAVKWDSGLRKTK